MITPKTQQFDAKLLYSCLSWILDGMDVNDLVQETGLTAAMAEAILTIENSYSIHIECMSEREILNNSYLL
jgi:hypothetical protein